MVEVGGGKDKPGAAIYMTGGREGQVAGAEEGLQELS